MQEHTIVYFSLYTLKEPGSLFREHMSLLLLLRQLQSQYKSEVKTNHVQLEGPS